MFVRHLDDCEEFIAGDGSALRELLHPDKADLRIRYSLAHAKLPASQGTKPHKLESAEVYYIIAGNGLMHIDDESCKAGPGCAIYIPAGSMQYIENPGNHDLIFLCIVDPAWRKEDEQIPNR